MSGRFSNPYPQFFNSTPSVYASGTLTFYASGTSTLQNIYTNEALSIAADNPLTLNSAGRAAVDIFLQDLEYKVVLKDSSGNTIWTADPVSARDSSYIAKTLTGSGSPNGSVAGTAGSSSILPDFYWDYTNSILYVCTTTGTTLTAVWTALNAASATPAVPAPQGRLTLTSATPVIPSSVSASAAVYYTPYIGNLVPIYSGSSMIPTTFSELTLTLVSSHAASAIYDVFVFSNSGVLTLATGPSWTTVTAGSGARGTGAATTELTRVAGLWVNAVSMTARNGASTYTVAANRGTYVGSIFMDGTNGQISCHVAWGQSRKWGVWNAYNRVPVLLKAGDSTASWSVSGGTRQSNADANNKLTIFSGLPEEMYDLRFDQQINAVANNTLASISIGIGYNSTSAYSGRASRNVTSSTGVIPISTSQTCCAQYIAPPAIGINNINALEAQEQAGSGNTMYGTEAIGMVLSAQWRA